MTERSHGLVLGKFSAGFIGLVAMAVLVTGAVAAANAPSASVLVADATSTPAATGTSTTTRIADASEDPSAEASEHASGGPESSAKAPKPAASCDPSLDMKEDAAELKSEGQNGDNNGDEDDLAPNATAAPTVLKTPEPSEPPSCKKVDPDSHGDAKSGNKVTPLTHSGSKGGPAHGGGGDEGFSTGKSFSWFR
jgi:hypothetical protein